MSSIQPLSVVTCALFATCAVSTGAYAGSDGSGKIFWMDDGLSGDTDTIYELNLDGSGEAKIVSNIVTNAGFVAVTNSVQKVYFYDDNHLAIRRGNPDGSEVENVIDDEDDPAIGIGTKGIAVDEAGGKVYWTDWLTDSIRRANVDGSEVELLVTADSGLNRPEGIALDLVNNKMYWVDRNTEKVQRANLDGSDVEDLVTEGLDRPQAIVLDVSQGQMYWTDWGTLTIYRANLDGSDVHSFIPAPGKFNKPWALAIDLNERKIYWTDTFFRTINRADLDDADGVIQPADVELVRAVDKKANPRALAVLPTTSSDPADLNGDSSVGPADLAILLGSWGPCRGKCAADLNGDGAVGPADLAQLLGAWG